MNSEEVLKRMHFILHSVRLIKGYRPTEFEVRISKLLVDYYKDSCDECREVSLKPVLESKNFFHKLGDLFKR